MPHRFQGRWRRRFSSGGIPPFEFPARGFSFGDGKFALSPRTEVIGLLQSRDLVEQLARADDRPLGFVEAAEVRGLAIPTVQDFAAPTGKGTSGTVEGHTVALGNLRFMREIGVEPKELEAAADNLRREGATAIFVAVAGKVAGVFAIADPIKASTPAALAKIAGSPNCPASMPAWRRNGIVNRPWHWPQKSRRCSAAPAAAISSRSFSITATSAEVAAASTLPPADEGVLVPGTHPAPAASEASSGHDGSVGEPDVADSAISMHTSLDLRHVYQVNVVYLGGAAIEPGCQRTLTAVRVSAD